MKSFFQSVLLVAMLLGISSLICLGSIETSASAALLGTGDSSQEDEESGDLFAQQLQDNYQNSFQQMLVFFGSMKSAMAEINKRLEIIEKASRSDGETLKRHTTALENLSVTIRLDEHLRLLSQPKKGETFNGSEIEDIAAAIPDDYALAVETRNYLSFNLTNRQSQVFKHNKELTKSPETILSKTREVFTFKTVREPTTTYPSQGGMLYRIGETGYSLHFSFIAEYGRFAAGFFLNNVSVQTIKPIVFGCSKYTHTGIPGTYDCKQIPINTTGSLTVRQDTLHAKLTFNSKKKSSILTVEVFAFVP